MVMGSSVSGVRRARLCCIEHSPDAAGDMLHEWMSPRRAFNPRQTRDRSPSRAREYGIADADGTPLVLRLVLAFVRFVAAAPPASGQGQPADLTTASIEDLMNIEITSVSRTAQRVGDVAAAVSVITRQLSLSVIGENLFDPAHAEFAGQGAIVIPTLIPRSASVNLIWRPRP
jgi:hypothetical protein